MASGDKDINELLKRSYDIYVDNLLRGCTQIESALRAGILLDDAAAWVRRAEMDSYVIARKEARFKNFDASTVWNPAVAVLSLASMAFDVTERGTNRLNAMRELNVLTGITIIDESGKTKLGGSIADFYRTLAGAAPSANEPERKTTH